MKKIFTICVCILATTAMFAQNTILPQPLNFKRISNLQHAEQGIVHRAAGSRAQCESLGLNYNIYEDFWATNIAGLTFNGGFNGGGLYGAELTNFVDTFHSYSNQYIKAVFDTLAFLVDDGSGTISTSFIPLSSTTISLDSLGMHVYLEGDSNLMTNDSLVFTISKRVGTVETPVKRVVDKGPSWFEKYYSDGTGIPYVQIPIGYQFLKGEGFAVKMQYYGKDTSSHFSYTFAYTDSCGTIDFQGQTLSSPAYKSPFGTMSYSNEIRPSGATATLSASNNGFAYNVPGVPVTCRYVYEQIYNLYPVLTVCLPYGVNIVPSQANGCPNGSVDLTASAFGTPSTNLTYTWSTNNDSLSSLSDPTTTLTLGSTGNSIVIVTLNDGTADVSDTFTVINSGINININNANPIVLSCGSSVTITTTATGVTAGKTYLWNNQATSQSVTTALAGPYSVTVTNNKGCSASASVNVTYNGGVTNAVNFTLPSGTICKDVAATYTNTSTSVTGWTATWDMDNNGVTLLTGTPDVSYAYPSPGFHQIKLKMDSAGCSFSSPIDNAHRANVSVCTGVEDVRFDNLINIVPNPTHGNVTITVNGVEQNISIKIYNVIGSEVKSFNASDVATSFTKTLDLNDLSNGTYLVKIQTADKTAIKRLIISK